MTSYAVAGNFRNNLEALAAAQKSARNTAAYSRLVNRPLGRLVAAQAHALGATPNQATAASAFLSASGLVLLSVVQPHWWVGVAIALFLAWGYIMDSVDGQLARLRGGGSRSGEWLDHTVDCFKTASLHIAVLISWFRFSEAADGWLLLPIAFEVVAVVTYFGLILMPTLRPALTATTLHPSVEHPLRKYALLPMDYGAQCWMFILLGWGAGFRATYAVVLLCNAAALCLALRKWWRELRLLDAAPPANRP